MGLFLASTSYSTTIPFEMLHVLNVARSWSLPSELFSVIFQHACPTPDVFIQEPARTPPFHLVLRLVSTSWYEIVQSTPQLWTCIVLPKICAENVDTKGRFLKLCLENSGCLPLTLSFRFDSEFKKADWFTCPVLGAALEHSTHRIQALRVFQPPRIWLEQLIPKMSQLTTIRIQEPQSYFKRPTELRRDQCISLPKTANPSRIHISDYLLNRFHFECAATSVTHMELRGIPVDIATEILLQCPNLVDFSYSYSKDAYGKDPRRTITSPFVLNHLSTFTWSTVTEWNRVLFENIHFPALKRFNLPRGYHFLPLNDTELALSLSRFPKTVTILEVEGCACLPGEKLGLETFLPLTSIIQLRLLHCNDTSIRQAFSVLSHETDGSNILFPKLTSIVIDNRPIEWEVGPRGEFGPGSGQRFVQMLRNRLGLMDEFTLTVESAHLTQHWDKEVWHALSKFKRNGLDLTIIEHGRPMII